MPERPSLNSSMALPRSSSNCFWSKASESMDRSTSWSKSTEPFLVALTVLPPSDAMRRDGHSSGSFLLIISWAASSPSTMGSSDSG